MALFSRTTTTQTELNTASDKNINNVAEDSISSLSFSPQADLLSVASWDKKVRIYEVTPAGESRGVSLYEHQAPVLSTHWFPDGTKVVSGGCDNAVRAHDLQSGQTIQIGQHDSAVSEVRVVNPGSPIVASCSWDKTLKYWDIRQSNSQPAITVALPERAYTMDAKDNLLVVGTAERHVVVINLERPGEIFKTQASALKWQTRVVTCLNTGSGYAIGSIEGRCAISYVDDKEQSQLGFSFKCHREAQGAAKNETLVYSVNAISVHPVYGTFSTAGSDGTFNIWDKDSKYRLKASNKAGGPITSTAFSRTGNIFAYAVSYDWSKGYQFNTPQSPIMVKLHAVAEEEVKQRPKKR